MSFFWWRWVHWRFLGSIKFPLLWVGLTVLPWVYVSPAQALCIAPQDKSLAALQRTIFRDPKAAIAQVERQLSQVQQPEQRAWLYAISAAAYGRLELNTEERREAEKGLKLPVALNSDVRAELESERASALSFPEEIKAARAKLADLRRLHSPSSPSNICLEAMMGSVTLNLGEIGEGGVMLTRAYDRATRLGLAQQRFAVTMLVVAPLVASGDYVQALEVVAEGEAYASTRDYFMELENIEFMRGQVSLREHEFSKAQAAFTQMRLYASRIRDEQGIGYADLSLCEAELELGRLAAARRACSSAARLFSKADSKSDSRLILLQARLDTKEGRLIQAREKLDGLVAGRYPATSHRIVTDAYRTRAELFTRLGLFKEAVPDLLQSLTRYEEEVEAARSRYIAIMRARFEADRWQLENAKLQRELALAHEEEKRRRLWLWTLAGWAAFLVIAFASFLVFNRRYQRMLKAHALESQLFAKTKADFLSNMSHEIRRPLGSLLLSAQMLAKGHGAEEQRLDLARRLGRTGERLLNLLDDLLLFSRIETGHVPLHITDFDLRDVLGEVVDMCAASATGQGVAVNTDVPATFPGSISSDRSKLVQILSNILDNAIKHSGGSVVSLSVLAADEDHYEIAVRDDGEGIALDQQEKLFQRFSQVDGAFARNGGSGLGLTIARGLSELMGGSISLTSRPGDGTQVIVSLPFSQPPTSQDRQLASYRLAKV